MVGTTPTMASLRSFARLVSTSLSKVQKGIASGRLEKSIGYDRRGRPMIVDVALARREWRENRDASQVRL